MNAIIYILLSVIYMANFVKIPSYSLSPDKITLFERIEWESFSEKQIEGFKNLQNNESKYNDLSDNGRRRILNAVNNMLYLSKNKEIIGMQKQSKTIADNEIIIQKGKKYKKKVKYKLTFITLTLSSEQRHTDKEITRHLLGSFLDNLRRKWKVDNYIWKAEKQENGNIHYHVLTDKYIHWKEIREVWNRIQNKEGYSYVDRYSGKMQKYFKNGFQMLPDERDKVTQYKAYLYNKKNNWTNPNSTDIHALYKVRNIAAYITKYVAKQVTKTSRTEQIDKLTEEIKYKEKQIVNLKYYNEFLTFSDIAYLNNLDEIYKNKREIEEHKNELNELKEKGITGRIWGQSQNLSKIKPFSDVENFRDIPDIDTVDKINRYKHELEVGQSNITTYFFDIEKTPNLQRILNEHISKSIRGPDLLDKLTFTQLEESFEKDRGYTLINSVKQQSLQL